ncbi:MAG TPA: macro domain-containing protein [Aggregatilineales bacterium]|nr:macro domain-containing protein [Aggregatilineales bacterium]
MFPTKRHWREHSDIEGIERGLEWIITHYETEGITSLALPALGCGEGKLRWEDVGRLLCRYMAKLPIPVYIYLPREQDIPPEQLTGVFLLET